MARRKSKHFSEIENYINIGFDAKDIPKLTNIPNSTVYSVVNKLNNEETVTDIMEYIKSKREHKYTSEIKRYYD